MFGSASAFASADGTQGGSDESGIRTTRLDGTGLRRLIAEPGDEYPPWSPDGGTIAFGRLTKAVGRIYVVSPDGGGLRRLTDPQRASGTASPPGPRTASGSRLAGLPRAGPTCT